MFQMLLENKKIVIKDQISLWQMSNLFTFSQMQTFRKKTFFLCAIQISFQKLTEFEIFQGNPMFCLNSLLKHIFAYIIWTNDHFFIFLAMLSTVCFIGLDKLNLQIMIRFVCTSRFPYCPNCVKKRVMSKVVKTDTKIIIQLPQI